MRGVAVPRARTALLAALLLAPLLTGCLVARIPDLLNPPALERPPAGTGDGGNASARFRVENVTWRVNDTWVWQGTNGARVTDRVVAVRHVERDVGGRLLTVLRYDVTTKEEWGADLLPLWSNSTYEAELAVVNSSALGESARYLRQGAEFRGIPLTYIGPAWFNHTVNLTRFGTSDHFERATRLTNLGQESVHVAAGQFTAWHVRLNSTTSRGPGTAEIGSASERWFSEEVRNDVRFVRRGVGFDLVAYRAGDDARSIALPNQGAAPALKVGWAWRYSDGNGVVMTRDVIACNTLFSLCRDEGGQRFVHYEGRDHFAYRTRITFGGLGFAQSDLALLPTSKLAPVASHFYTSLPEQWRPLLNFTGDVPTIPPPAASRDTSFFVKGIGAAGPLDHQGIARIVVGGAETVPTPLGNLTGPRVVTNVTYVPTEAYGEAFYDEVSRVWSQRARNDVATTLAFGGASRTFTLEAVTFGDARKAERDI